MARCVAYRFSTCAVLVPTLRTLMCDWNGNFYFPLKIRFGAKTGDLRKLARVSWRGLNPMICRFKVHLRSSPQILHPSPLPCPFSSAACAYRTVIGRWVPFQKPQSPIDRSIPHRSRLPWPIPLLFPEVDDAMVFPSSARSSERFEPSPPSRSKFLPCLPALYLHLPILHRVFALRFPPARLPALSSLSGSSLFPCSLLPTAWLPGPGPDPDGRSLVPFTPHAGLHETITYPFLVP